jgi:hypothetical protein
LEQTEENSLGFNCGFELGWNKTVKLFSVFASILADDPLWIVALQ